MTKIPTNCSIRGPGELRNLLKQIQAAVDEKLLEECSEARSEFAPDVTIGDVPLDGPWPDFFELRFRDAVTGKLYKLEVETYHGAGGEWSDV